MFAVIKTGGKQFKVQVGQTIDVEKLEAEEGTEIRIDDVLLAAEGAHVSYGRPMIDGATVTARVVSQHRGPKLVVFKYKSKARYRRRTGHRQSLTLLQIQSIAAPGFDTVTAPEPAAYEPAVIEAAPVATTVVDAPVSGSTAPADDVLTPAGPAAQIDSQPSAAVTPEIGGDATLPTPGGEQLPTE